MSTSVAVTGHEQGPHNQAKAHTLQNLEPVPTCVRPVKVAMRRRPTVRPPRSSSDDLTVGLLTLPATHQKTYQFPAYQFPAYQFQAYQFPAPLNVTLVVTIGWCKPEAPPPGLTQEQRGPMGAGLAARV